MGGMVAEVAERGYEATRVADVLKRVGVSRSAYYNHFTNKDECFLEALDAMLALAEPTIAEVYGETPGDWEDRLRAAFDRAVELIVVQPAAARCWFIEAHPAGTQALDRIERIGDRLEGALTKAMRASPGREGMPPAIVRATLGAARQVIRNRLRQGLEAELVEIAPDLVDWAVGYPAPTATLRRPRKPPRLPSATPNADPQAERILTAVTEGVAEKGYQALTVTEIAQRAGVSLTTLYALFENKPAVFLAALDDAERRLTETVVPFYEGAADWPHAIKDSMHAVFAFLASNPSEAKLGNMEALAGGSEALARQDKTRESFRALLYPGFKEFPDTPDVAGEAIGSAIAALIYQQLRRAGAERLYEATPTAIYLALAPFLGAEQATAIANESWQPGA